MAHQPSNSARTTAAEKILLGIFLLFTAAAVTGYAVFGRHPQLLAHVPNGMQTYGVAFLFFPRAHVLLAFAVLAFVLFRHAGFRWLPAFAAMYALSLLSELAGTTVGLPFGPYRYTNGLGLKLFDHVPVLIPLSWFFMALPSYVLATRALRPSLLGGPARDGVVVVSGSVVLLAWDLALDPAMSWITKYWVWGTDGAYYGMPLLNLFGWWVTGIALMAALRATRAERWTTGISSGWMLGFYLVNLALPLGMIAAAGLWPAVALTVVVAGASLLWPRLLPWVATAGVGRARTLSRSDVA